MTDKTAEQTAIRLGLLANGYVPLANRDKLCALRGWPGLVVDEAKIEEWAGQLRYMATGVRVDGPLLVLDFDIDHGDLLDAVWDRLDPALAARLEAAPMRAGRGEKFALFCRLVEGEARVGRQVSQGYAPPESPDTLMRVEAFDSGSPRQFGAFGPHSHAPDGSVEVSYRWAGGVSLLDVPLADLPALTRDEVSAVLDAASGAMLDAGWTYEVRTHAGVVDHGAVHDLTEDMVFVTESHGALGLDDLEDLCRAIDPAAVRLSASWLEGERAVNTSRCIARINAGDGRLQVWESASCRLHRPVDADMAHKIDSLASRLAERGVGGREGVSESGMKTGSGEKSRLDLLLEAVPPENRFFAEGAAEEGGGVTAEAAREASGADAFDAALASLLEGWAWVTVGSGYVAPVGGTADQMMTLGGLTNTMAPWCKVEKKGKRWVEVNPAAEWLKHPARLMVAGHRLLPWSTEMVTVDEGGQAWLNTYRPPAHGGRVEDEGVARAAEAVWERFLAHLVPDARERAWFETWLAAKVQRPWLPNCGVVMVAETHGTGRGTLFDVLGAVMGERHVKPVSSTEIMGGSGQGQYTDWLADALLVTCDELLAGNDAGGSMEWKRREVYERLKTYVDPRARRVRIVRKGLPGYETEVFASFLMATNNPNALPLAEQDRRFAVLRNTEVKLADAEGGALLGDLSRYRDESSRFSEAFGAVVWRRLSRLAVDWDAVRDAPQWLEGRADMLAANEGDLEEIVGNVLADVPGDYLLNEHLRSRLALAIEASGMQHEMKNWWARAQDLLARRNGTGWRRMTRRQDAQPRAAGRRFVVVYYRLDGAGEAAWTETPVADRPDLWKRGADLNDRLSRLESAVRARGMKVVE